MTRSRRTHRFWIVSAACLLVGAGGFPGASLALEPVVHEVTIGGFRLRVELATSRRTDRGVGEFRYRAELVNETGTDATDVVAEVSHSLAATSILDDLLIFGDVPAGATVASRDSFSFVHDRSIPFDPGKLSYVIRQAAIPDVPDWAGTIGSGGGITDAGQGGVVLDFPSGAVFAETPIRITPLSGGFDRTRALASTAHDFGPDGIVFSQPVWLTLRYDPSEIPNGVSAVEAISIAKLVGEEWVSVPGSVVDPVAATVSAPVDGFSSFVAVRSGPDFLPPPPPEPDPGGDLDPSFGSDGIAVFDLGFSLAEVNAVALEPAASGASQRILLAARSPWIAAVRILANAEGLDPSFGAGGIAARSVQAASKGQAIALQSDGRILVAGSSNETPPETGLDLVMLRFEADGRLDESFADAGVLIEHRGPGQARAVEILPDGRIMAVAPFGLLQYTAQGTFDPTFGTDGIWSPGESNAVQDALRRASGFWAVLVRTSIANVQLRRVTPGGSESEQGTISRSSFSQRPSPTRMAETPSGASFVVGGTVGTAFPFRDLFATRFQASDLQPSALFAGDGILEGDFGDDEVVRAIAIQEDGRVLLAGSSRAPDAETDGDFLVVRLRPDGFVDTLFGDGGLVLVDFGGDDTATDITIDAEGRILVVGESKQGGVTRAALARLLP